MSQRFKKAVFTVLTMLFLGVTFYPLFHYMIKQRGI